MLVNRRIWAVFFLMMGLVGAVRAWAGKGDAALAAGKGIVVKSPDGVLGFELTDRDGKVEYGVVYKGMVLVERSPLGLTFGEGGAGGGNGGGEFGGSGGLGVSEVAVRKGRDDYSLVVGKTREVHDEYNEGVIGLVEKAGLRRRVNLVVRVFNDGVAFRYEIPEQAGWSSYSLVDEGSSFRVVGDPMMMASFLPDFTSSHEGLYTKGRFGGMKEDSLMDMPVFLEFGGTGVEPGKRAAAGRVYAAITEARLVDYAGMYLIRRGDRLKCELSPLPGQVGTVGELERGQRTAVRVKAVLPHRSPWRVMLVSERAGALVESNILTDLNDDCALQDVSWLKPGKTDFHWWNGDIVPDTNFSPGINFETNQYYIDFCARNGIDYHSVIGYGGIAWYVNDGVSYDAGPHADPTRPVPGLDMQRICDYARSKGVGIRVWVHWRALWPMVDSAFAQFERWGIRGMMVDFLNRDDQEMVNIQVAILQKAAAHHLHIQFHGAYKPTGMSRTYPNEFTREGTLNYENDKWGNPITPDDDLNVVFTRLLAGPTDYHLGGFRAVTPAGYVEHFTRPVVLGTRCHMLAMYVVLESYLGMVCDYPAAYEGQPGFDFVRAVPTTWDETRVPVAIPGERVTVARRKGNEWWVGTINSGVARDVVLRFGWLPPGKYVATVYSDAADAGENPNDLVKETRMVNAGDSIILRLAAGGGQVMRLRRE